MLIANGKGFRVINSPNVKFGRTGIAHGTEGVSKLFAEPSLYPIRHPNRHGFVGPKD
jgi:hypothetical protein